MVGNVDRLLAQLFEAISNNSALCLEGKYSKIFLCMQNLKFFPNGILGHISMDSTGNACIRT